MSITYNISTDFAAKDSLPDGDPEKVVKGAAHSTEFLAIQAAFELAATKSSPTFTGTSTFTNVSVSGTFNGRDPDADGTKLDGIEAGATADQTGAEIKAVYEGEADTNAFTDTLLSKLNGIEAGATNTGDPAWGSISGSLSSQTDLQNALDAKQDSISTSLTLGLWTISIISNELVFDYNGTDVAKIATSGAITTADDITAFGSV